MITVPLTRSDRRNLAPIGELQDAADRICDHLCRELDDVERTLTTRLQADLDDLDDIEIDELRRARRELKRQISDAARAGYTAGSIADKLDRGVLLTLTHREHVLLWDWAHRSTDDAPREYRRVGRQTGMHAEQFLLEWLRRPRM